MSTLQIKQQKPADKLWIDEQGMKIPVNRVTPFEKKKENGIGKLAKEAVAINAKLMAFKENIRLTAEELYQDMLKSEKGLQGKGKGNVTLYNFDMSIKVEVNINEPIHFNEEYIKMAKAELDTIFETELDSTSSWIKGLIMEAFTKSRGELDTDKVLSLKKHASRVPAHLKERYDKAMSLIDKAITRPTSKTYYRVWVRNSEGQFENVQLNFSAV